MKEKINDVIERLFHLECETLSIHKAAKDLLIKGGLSNDAWLKVNKVRERCISILNTLNS
ncbi:MAG: hypothetical protein IJP85_05860 [Synergistaceae bacterium]|nr:hypothetical protein [Synergistaceae bacterium]